MRPKHSLKSWLIFIIKCLRPSMWSFTSFAVVVQVTTTSSGNYITYKHCLFISDTTYVHFRKVGCAVVPWKNPEMVIWYQCNIYSGPLRYWDYFSSGSSGLLQRLTSRHAENESLSHSSKWCDRLSQPFTSVYFIGCGSCPQIFISFYGCVMASIAKRSGGGRALR